MSVRRAESALIVGGAHLAASAAMSAVTLWPLWRMQSEPEFGWAFRFGLTFLLYAVVLAPVSGVLFARRARTWLSWTFWALAAVALVTLVNWQEGLGLIASFPILAICCALILHLPKRRRSTPVV